MEEKKKQSSNKSNSTKKTTTAKKTNNSVKNTTTAKTSAAKKNTSTVKKTTSANKTGAKNVKKTTSNVDLKKKREEQKPKVDLIKVEPKTSKKDFDSIKIILYAIGIFLIALGVLFNNALLETEFLGLVLGDLVIPTKLIGILLIGFTAVKQAVRSEKNGLLKSLAIVFGLSYFATWIFSAGYLSGSEVVLMEGYGLNFNDIVSVLYNGIYMCIDKIIILILIGFFYKIASTTGAYHELIKKVTTPFVGKENIFSIGLAALVIILMSFVTESYIVLALLPFFISMLAFLKVDKVTAFAVTFGALIAGMIGSPYGTEALSAFNYYASLTLEDALMYRIILQLCVIVLFAFFVNLRLKSNTSKEAVKELFLTEDDSKKVSVLPLAIIMVTTFLLLTLGYVNWYSNFGIETFYNFQEWIYTLTIGDYPVVEILIGASTEASVFGEFTIFDGMTILSVMSIILILAYRIKLQEVLNILVKTIKFLAKPLLVIFLISCVFTIGYITQFIVIIGQYILSLSAEFNPFTSAIVAALSGLLSNDLGFTAYLFSGYFTASFTDYTSIYGLVYTSIYGIIQLVIPTSPILIGLYYTDISYKTWLKYIAVFFAGILVVALLLITVITYLA